MNNEQIMAYVLLVKQGKITLDDIKNDDLKNAVREKLGEEA